MRIDTKFSVNDRVFWIYPRTQDEDVACGFCGGAGEVEGLNGNTATCPVCKRSKRCIETVTRWHVREGRVEKITISVQSKITVLYFMGALHGSEIPEVRVFLTMQEAETKAAEMKGQFAYV